ncbi:BTAD domain-containing putative transcriptional regulator [Tenggerimyces flavus]|uniref:BTAD domain-containing putative transcriptional regulator n=1 Tax=Tenggerimyces flavus TaxID=1708749 RepID=A0ABV7Y457_9ACTN|nr:BTAD domain-containing putative transcriptional regulator [Tenggerimyces flavus]MBM7788555.1 DNA-binding SARP family transcriptional activator [Tenggerimyces flavus]
MVAFTVLGGFGALHDGRPIDLGGPRQRSVLARLLVARGRVLPADTLVEDVWPLDTPVSGQATLQTYVSHLRRALEPDRQRRAPATLLLSVAPGYALRPEQDDVDAWRFESLVRKAVDAHPVEAARLLDDAIAVCAGPAYGEFSNHPWARAEQARHDELVAVARERRAAAWLALGRAADAVPDLEVYVREYPLREEGWRLLALALYRVGRQGDALGAIRRARAELVDALGVDPGQALRQLEAMVLDHDPRLHEEERQRATAVSKAEFVGRTQELQALAAAAEQARTSSAVALIAGEPGAGKSALTTRFADELADSGWLVAWGSCPEGDGVPAAWPWTEVLGTVTTAETPDATTASALAPLRAAGDAETADPSDGRFRLHHAVATYLNHVATTRPVAVVLDDVHRADTETLALLGTVTDLAGPRLLVVATMRPNEITQALRDLLARLATKQPVRLDLHGLAATEVQQLVAQLSGRACDEPTARRLAERTDGNPFYVGEIARLLAAGDGAENALPAGVRDVIRRRIDRLGDETGRVLNLAAVIGRDLPIDVLLEAAGTTAIDALESAVSAGLLVEAGPGQLRFAHVLVRDTLYEELPVLRRTHLHGVAAAALRTVRPNDLVGLAHHYGQARDARPAVDYARAAAEQTARRYASRAAAGLWRQALAALDHVPDATTDERIELLAGLVRAEAGAGNAMAARGARADAIRLAAATGDQDLVEQAVTAWDVPVSWAVRDYAQVDPDTAGIIWAAAEAVPPEDAERRSRLLACYVIETEGNDERSGFAAAEALRLARTTDKPELVALALNAWYYWTQGEIRPTEHGETGAELVELGHRTQQVGYRVLGHIASMQAAATRGDLDTASRHAATVQLLAEDHELGGPAAEMKLFEAMRLVVQGRLEEAAAKYDEACDRLREIGSFNAEDVRWICRYTVAYVAGRLADLADSIQPMVERYPEVARDPYTLILLAQGRVEEARQVWRPDGPIRHDYFRLMFLALRAECAIALGDADAAAKLYDTLEPYTGLLAGANNGAFPVAPVDQQLGGLALVLGRSDDARAHFGVALDLARKVGSPIWVRQAQAGLSECG